MKFKILWPLFVFALIAPFTPKLDLAISHFFYSERHFQNNAFFHFLFQWGERFGFLVAGFSSFIFLLSFWKKKWISLRRPVLTLILTFVLGAGVLTNSLLKEYWGRPRPKQIEEFGGHHAYRPFWKPNFHTKNDPQKSFPSGHVAMGFYFLSLCLVGRRFQHKTFFYTGCFLTTFLGGGLMIARVAQGGHFFSDVLASAVLMWFVAIAIDYTIFVRQWDRKLFTWVGFEKQVHDLKLPDTSPKPDDASKAAQ